MVLSGVGKERLAVRRAEWRREADGMGGEGRCLVGGEDEVHEKGGLANWERGGGLGFGITA